MRPGPKHGALRVNPESSLDQPPLTESAVTTPLNTQSSLSGHEHKHIPTTLGVTPKRVPSPRLHESRQGFTSRCPGGEKSQAKGRGGRNTPISLESTNPTKASHRQQGTSTSTSPKHGGRETGLKTSAGSGYKRPQTPHKNTPAAQHGTPGKQPRGFQPSRLQCVRPGRPSMCFANSKHQGDRALSDHQERGRHVVNAG